MKKKTLALILAALQLTVLLAACDGGKKPADTTGSSDTTAPAVEDTTAPADTEDLTEAEKRALIDDELPDDKKFGGRDFIIISTDSRVDMYDVDEQSGVTLNDAIYARNSTVETDYDVKIGFSSYADRHAVRAAIEQAMTSGDVEAFDLVAYHMVDNAANAVAGHYLNWYEIPYVNFEKPWWSDSNINELTVNGKCFIALGDLSITAIRNVWCYAFNKQMAADLQVEDMYQLVRDGKWTLDKVREISEQVYGDLNADGMKNEGDRFGLGSYMGSGMNAYLWSFNNPIIKIDDTGVPQYTLNTDRFPDLVTSVIDLYHNTQGVYFCEGADSTRHFKLFLNGEVLMVSGSFTTFTNEGADATFSLGALPYPKYNEEQDDYYTMIDGSGDSMGVSKIESDDDVAFIGLITEALCAESYKQIWPVYYDSMLKGRYADMPDDAEMIELIVNSRIYDMGYIYDNWKGAGFYMQDLVKANNTNVASFMASRWKTAELYYDQVLDLFSEE